MTYLTEDKGNRAGRLDLDSYLPYRLSILSNTVSGAISALYEKKFGLSVAEWRIMAILGMVGWQGGDPLSQTDLSARTRMDKVQVSRAVRRLEAASCVVRETDSNDRRRARLTLTKKGRLVYDTIAPATLAWEQKFLSRLSEAEAAILDTVISRMQQIADELADSEFRNGS